MLVFGVTFPGAVLCIFAVLAGTCVQARETALGAILANMERVGGLYAMDNGRTYELEARGEKKSGVPDDFLRARTPEEILKSGLSCGCGDYAYAFYRLMQNKGFQVLYVDAAQLSIGSVLNHDNGHTAVAVKDPDSGNWILVDPTFGQIVSADWDAESRVYDRPFGHLWIGYKGPLEQYPVKDHAGLKKFYVDTLATVPKGVWEKELLGFDFVIDASMRTKKGGYTNPRLEAFIHRPGEVYRSLGIVPARVARVTLKDGGPVEISHPCAKTAAASWTCLLGRTQGLNASFNDWMTREILRSWDQAVPAPAKARAP